MKEFTTNEDLQNEQNKNEFEKPPIFGTWKTFYSVVLGELVVLIVLFYVFGEYFGG